MVCECITAAARSENRVTVTSAEGARESASAFTEILPAASTPRPPETSSPAPLGPATGTLRLSVRSTTAAVGVGQSTAFFVEIHNDRTVSDRNVAVTITLSPGLELQRFVSISSNLAITPRGDGTFDVEPISELRAGESQTFRVEVTARQAGDQILRARAVSLRTRAAVEAQQATRVQGGP
jgi:hypothetical protein